MRLGLFVRVVRGSQRVPHPLLRLAQLLGGALRGEGCALGGRKLGLEPGEALARLLLRLPRLLRRELGVGELGPEPLGLLGLHAGAIELRLCILELDAELRRLGAGAVERLLGDDQLVPVLPRLGLGGGELVAKRFGARDLLAQLGDRGLELSELRRELLLARALGGELGTGRLGRLAQPLLGALGGSARLAELVDEPLVLRASPAELSTQPVPGRPRLRQLGLERLNSAAGVRELRLEVGTAC